MPRWLQVDAIWRGQTAVIIGGGASLTAGQIRLVARARLGGAGYRVLAVNDSVYVAWWSDWLHGADLKWWTANADFLKRFAGTKSTIDELVPNAWVTGHLRVTGLRGFDPNPSSCRTGNNSGFQAMHIAIHLGVRRIVLVGFDMRHGHWHEGGEDCNYRQDMVPHFHSLMPTLAERKIEVLNTCERSLLTMFPYMSLPHALSLPVCP